MKHKQNHCLKIWSNQPSVMMFREKIVDFPMVTNITEWPILEWFPCSSSSRRQEVNFMLCILILCLLWIKTLSHGLYWIKNIYYLLHLVEKLWKNACSRNLGTGSNPILLQVGTQEWHRHCGIVGSKPYCNCADEIRTLHLHSGSFGLSQTAIWFVLSMKVR